MHAVHRAAWGQTYPALGVSDADIDARFPDRPRAIDDEQRRLASPVTRSWVARVGGRLVGYCRAAVEGDAGRIESIYVLAGHQSRGIGGALLGRALEWLGPDRDVFVDTHRANGRAHAFYRRFGFAPTGLVKDSARGGAVMLASGAAFPDVEMVRSGRRTREGMTAEPDGVLGDGGDLAIVTETVDWGGMERVVQVLADRLPSARIVAHHFGDGPGEAHAGPWAARADLLPSGRRKRHFLSPLYARRLARAPIGSPRVVLALAGGGWVLAAPLPPGARLLCYSAGLPPPLYGEARLYLRSEPAPLRPLLLGALPALRAQVRRLMRRPHRLLTVSRASAQALSRVYGREAEVVHPPVRTRFFTPAAAPAPGRHFLAVARLVPSKRLEVAIDAFAGLDETLVIAGRGPLLEPLRARASSNVRFAGWVDDEELRELYRSSRALVCPSVEEFGLVMAEAQACGVPVIAPRAGGALEIVEDPATGILLDRVDARSVAAAVRDVTANGLDPRACRTSAERFAQGRFVARMERIVAEEVVAARASSGDYT